MSGSDASAREAAATLPRRGLARPGSAPPRLTARWPSRPMPAEAPGKSVVAWIVLAAILSQLTLSANLLEWVGIHYDTPGGLPLEKFHLGTYLAVLAVALQAARQRPVMARLVARLADAPHFAAATALMLLCSAYTLFSTGMSGSAVYIESYAAAGLLGMAFEPLAPDRRRMVAYAMLAAFVGNALLCIVETTRQRLFVPVWLTNPEGFVVELPTLAGEFRGTALYANPLAGGLMSMMGVLLCLACALRPAVRLAALAVLLVSLISFGGRTAMLATYVLVAALAARGVLRRLILRRLSGTSMAAAAAGLVAVPGALGVLLFATPLGARISGKVYVDDSATVRVVQWLILGWMDLRDWLFGMGPDRLNTAMIQIGLDPPLNDIENFWLLVFVSLGVVGFAIWLGALSILLRRLWIAPGPLARVILLSVLLVASGSNSLGRKSNILFVCVACVMAQTGFAVPPAGRGRAARPRFRTSPEIS